METHTIYLLLGAGLGLYLLKGLVSRFRSKKVKQKIAAGAKVIDVRTAAEFRSGHYPNAINIPVDQFEKKISELASEKSRAMILYCASGMRSSAAAGILKRAGFPDVMNAGSLHNMPEL